MATNLTLPVQGMSCAGCENNIRFALSSLAGIERVHADHQAAHVEIVYDPAQTDGSRAARRRPTGGSMRRAASWSPDTELPIGARPQRRRIGGEPAQGAS